MAAPDAGKSARLCRSSSSRVAGGRRLFGCSRGCGNLRGCPQREPRRKNCRRARCPYSHRSTHRNCRDSSSARRCRVRQHGSPVFGWCRTASLPGRRPAVPRPQGDVWIWCWSWMVVFLVWWVCVGASIARPRLSRKSIAGSSWRANNVRPCIRYKAKGRVLIGIFYRIAYQKSLPVGQAFFRVYSSAFSALSRMKRHSSPMVASSLSSLSSISSPMASPSAQASSTITAELLGQQVLQFFKGHACFPLSLGCFVFLSYKPTAVPSRGKRTTTAQNYSAAFVEFAKGAAGNCGCAFKMRMNSSPEIVSFSYKYCAISSSLRLLSLKSW